MTELNKGNSAVDCRTKRDDLIVNLWQQLRELFDIIGAGSFTIEDADLWAQLAKHSSIQKRLNKKEKKP